MRIVIAFRGLAIAVLALALGGVATPAQDKKPEPVIGEMFVQEIPALHFLHDGFQTDFKSMGKPVGEALGGIVKATAGARLSVTGPVLQVYRGAAHTTPDKGFKMEAGFLVKAGSKGIGDYRVRELPKYKCASIVYVGPGHRLGDAWRNLYKSVQDKGITPTDEERELILYFEGVDSPNNVVQVMVGVK
jgi:effector-binding domain-containing protein